MGKICKECSNVLNTTIKNNDILMVCKCGKTEKGDDYDCLIEKKIYKSTIKDFSEVIKRLSNDDICKKIDFNCKCGMPYINVAVLGKGLKAIKICKNCGII